MLVLGLLAVITTQERALTLSMRNYWQSILRKSLADIQKPWQNSRSWKIVVIQERVVPKKNFSKVVLVNPPNSCSHFLFRVPCIIISWKLLQLSIAQWILYLFSKSRVIVTIHCIYATYLTDNFFKTEQLFHRSTRSHIFRVIPS